MITCREETLLQMSRGGVFRIPCIFCCTFYETGAASAFWFKRIQNVLGHAGKIETHIPACLQQHAGSHAHTSTSTTQVCACMQEHNHTKRSPFFFLKRLPDLNTGGLLFLQTPAPTFPTSPGSSHSCPKPSVSSMANISFSFSCS